MDLYSYLRKMLNTTASYDHRPNYTHYRNFILFDVAPIRKNRINYQKLLETYRPTIDYIILPTNQLLIGFTKDYTDLTKSALELSMQHLLVEQRKVLSAYQHLSSICDIYKSPIPYSELFPEQFI